MPERINQVKVQQEALNTHFENFSLRNEQNSFVPKKDQINQTKKLTNDQLFRPSKPLLPLPLSPNEESIQAQKGARSFQKNIISFVNRIEQMRQEEVEYAESRIDRISEGLLHTKQQEAEKLAEKNDKEQDLNTWSFYANLAAALVSAASIVIGGTLLGSGVGGVMVTGGMMVGSGACSLLGIGLTNAGVDPKITGTLSLCSAAMGIVAGGISFFSYADQLPKMVTAIVQALTNIAGGVNAIGKERNNYQKALLDRELNNLQNKLGRERYQFDEVAKTLKEEFKNLECEEIASVVRDYQHSMRKIVADMKNSSAA